jgi:O-antigen ligase
LAALYFAASPSARSWDARFDFWPDVVYALKQYFPFGSGLGTFEPVFNAAERLSIVGPLYVNHAHNDYLEILVESGLFGAALVLAGVCWMLWRGWRVWRAREHDASVIFARAAFIVLILPVAHSLVDYPLRTLALSAAFGLFSGMLANSRSSGRQGIVDYPILKRIEQNEPSFFGRDLAPTDSVVPFRALTEPGAKS